MPFADKDKDKAYKASYRERNREKAKAYAKEYFKKNPPHPDKVRERKLKHKFGLSLEQYNQMFEEQSGCCEICGRHQTEFNKRLAVDHCHTTGKIRSLLCANCNQSLGLLRENPATIKAMLLYLERFK